MSQVLILGSGSRPNRLVMVDGKNDFSTDTVTKVDWNNDHKPDVVTDLEQLPYSWGKSDFYDEIHAYEILEHTGAQGDWKFFFDQFAEIYRMLKDEGVFCATVPSWQSEWAWADPSHKRVFPTGMLVFLSQRAYVEQVGITPMSDFRFYYKCNFEKLWENQQGDVVAFCLIALKSGQNGFILKDGQVSNIADLSPAEGQ